MWEQRLLPLSSCGHPSVRVCTPTSSSDEDPSHTGAEPALVTLFCLNQLFKSPLQVQSLSEVPGNLGASPCGFGGERFGPEHVGSSGRQGTSCGAPKVLEVGAKKLYLRIFSTLVLDAFTTKGVCHLLSSKCAFSELPLSWVLRAPLPAVTTELICVPTSGPGTRLAPGKSCYREQQTAQQLPPHPTPRPRALPAPRGPRLLNSTHTGQCGASWRPLHPLLPRHVGTCSPSRMQRPQPCFAWHKACPGHWDKGTGGSHAAGSTGLKGGS